MKHRDGKRTVADWKDKAQVAAYMREYGKSYDRKKAKPRQPFDRVKYQRDYVERNREAIKAYQKEYRAKNKQALQAHKTAWRRKNREQTNEINRRYRAKNPDKQRAWAIRFKYGLTREQLAALGEHCDICGVHTTIGKTKRGERTQRCVDHDHDAGIVRGLLCARCNFAVGLLDDSPERFRAAAAYLERVCVERAS